MRFDILTLLPGFFTSPLKQSVIGRALENGVFEVHTHNIRDYASDKHRTTDDSPYGGGSGMVMKVEPVAGALEAVTKELTPAPTVVLSTPQGARFDHDIALRLSEIENIVIICGRYEGVDERIRAYADMELSIGDYVLSGGEIAALTIVDAVARLVPGVLGNEDSARSDSFGDGLLEGPHYTRPEKFAGASVPDVLLSGNHAEIERWRRTQSIRRTFERRPDLLDKAGLTDKEKAFVDELIKEKKHQ